MSKIDITILNNSAILKSEKAIPITDMPLELVVSSRIYDLTDMYVSATNGGKTGVFELVNGRAIIPSFLKTAGTLHLNFSKIKKCETVKSWACEEITLSEIDGQRIAIPEILSLKQEVSALREAVAELKKIIIEREEF